uniref:Uncharacterized protein n=1 Tax=Anguilla anguilla TaxID=7936 RepID=A0A0E9QXS7_ANGAN
MLYLRPWTSASATSARHYPECIATVTTMAPYELK